MFRFCTQPLKNANCVRYSTTERRGQWLTMTPSSKKTPILKIVPLDILCFHVYGFQMFPLHWATSIFNRIISLTHAFYIMTLKTCSQFSIANLKYVGTVASSNFYLIVQIQ